MTQDALRLQLEMKHVAEQQSEALASVGSWLCTVGEAEERMLRERRARPRPREAVVAARAAAPLGPCGVPLDPLDALHEDGNAAMGAAQYAKAADLYTRVLCGRPGSVAALANRSLANLKLHDFSGCIVDATLALRSEPTHVKCWFRRAQARNSLGQHAFALADLSVAHALDPGNKTTLVELRKTEEMVKSCRRRRPDVAIPLTEEEI